MDIVVARAFLNKHTGSGVNITEEAALNAIREAVKSASFGAKEDALLLAALEAAGVENWEGWETAQEIFHELLLEAEEENEDESDV